MDKIIKNGPYAGCKQRYAKIKALANPLIYKKGQIIPRSFLRCKNRKTQHLFKFGCDVAIVNRDIYALSDGPVYLMNGSVLKGYKGKPNLHASPCINNVNIHGGGLAVLVA